MLINDAFVNDNFKTDWRPIRGAELFSAGWCNLNCKYCYIPKADFLKDIHKDVIKKIKSGELLKELYDLYGEDLKYLSHWGTEPTLTTKYFKDFYNEAFDLFPNLEEVFISSNFMTNPDNIIKFATEIIPEKRKIKLGFQFSIDGPQWITDENRVGGSTELMTKNVLHFIKAINEIGSIHRLSTHVKPTINENQIDMLSDISLLEKYYDFFEELFGLIHDANKNDVIHIQRHVDPTTVNPGSWTKQNGINFTKLLKNQKILRQKPYKNILLPKPPYYHKWINNLLNLEQFYIKHHQFGCSAGNNTYAIGERKNTLHTCHRSFYLDSDKYTAEAQNFADIFTDAIDNAKLLGRESIVDTTDKYKFLKQLYVDRLDKDFTKLNISNGIAICYELAREGFIKEKYKSPTAAYLLLALTTNFECIIDTRFITGSYHIPDINILKLFGNGALEEYIKSYLSEEGGKCERKI